MKHLFRTLNLVLLLLVVGCAAIQAIDWGKVVGAIAHAGLTTVLRNNPQAAAFIGVTQTILDAFIAKKSTDISALERDLQQVPPEWREFIKVALDEAGSKIGAELTDNQKLELWGRYLKAIRDGVANVGKPASAGTYSREYQEAKRILSARGYNLSSFPASGPNELVPAYGWRTLWIPGVVAWAECPVTPDKFPPPWWTPNYASATTGRY
jgi:hypothetical protein